MMMKSHCYYLLKKQQKHGDPSAAAFFGGVVVSAADASPRFLGGGMDSFIQKSADGDYCEDDIMVGNELSIKL